MTITPAQCRAARGLLGWKQADLGVRAQIHRKTVESFEKCNSLQPNNVGAIRAAFEKEGVIFSSLEGEFQDGVALRWGSEDRAKLKDEMAKNTSEEMIKQAMREFWHNNKDVWTSLPSEMRDTLEERMGALSGEDIFENARL